MGSRLVFSATKVMGFSPAGKEDSYVSRLADRQRKCGRDQHGGQPFHTQTWKENSGGQSPRPL